MLGVTKAACFPCTFEERFNIFENTPSGFSISGKMQSSRQNTFGNVHICQPQTLCKFRFVLVQFKFYIVTHSERNIVVQHRTYRHI